MSIWLKYHVVFFGGPLLSFFIFFLVAIMGYLIPGLIVMGGGVLISVIVLLTLVCPKCKTVLFNSNSIFSKYYKGYQIFIPKKCVNCGCNLDEVEMPTYSKEGEEGTGRKSI